MRVRLPVQLAAALTLLFAPSWAHATWSVAAADTATKAVAIATATCVPQSVFDHSPFKGLPDLQAVVAPGSGVAAAQAQSDPTHGDQTLIREALRAGDAPSEIVKELQAKGGAVATRQFGVVDVHGRAAAFSGDAIPAEAAARQGRAGNGGRFAYAIQGNTLRSGAVVDDAARAFETSSGGLADRVLAALYAGDLAGGDRRCTCATAPLPKGPCARRNALIAYLIVASSRDVAGPGGAEAFETFIYVTDQNTLETESADPVETLRARYAAPRGQSR